MIINLWSTPRTGSVWYSNHLASQYKNSLLITEMFNRFHMNMYHVRDEHGVIKNYHEYVDGGFFKEFTLDSENFLVRNTINGSRTRTVEQEESYCWDLLKKRNNKQVLVLHNHIDPINSEIRQWLLENASKNIWICRRDRKQQLASYAVALSTKKFAAFKPQLQENTIVSDCDRGPLENLMRRIRVWESFPKSDIVEFEDIEFYDKPGFPYDQNSDPWSRLSPNMKQIITEICDQ